MVKPLVDNWHEFPVDRCRDHHIETLSNSSPLCASVNSHVQVKHMYLNMCKSQLFHAMFQHP